jgi:hypothetical protein
MYGSLAIYATASMHFAVEGAARCYSVNASQCGSATTTPSPLTVSYAQNHYLGPGSPTFTASLSNACGNPTNQGHQVNATLKNVVPGTYVAPLNITLSATACFP